MAADITRIKIQIDRPSGRRLQINIAAAGDGPVDHETTARLAAEPEDSELSVEILKSLVAYWIATDPKNFSH